MVTKNQREWDSSCLPDCGKQNRNSMDFNNAIFSTINTNNSPKSNVARRKKRAASVAFGGRRNIVSINGGAANITDDNTT